MAPPSLPWRVPGLRRGAPHHRARENVALLVVRVVLAWIFIYYGGGKLFGWFNGPGIHRTSLFMATVAHLRPGGFFAVLGGVIELGGGCLVGLGLGARLGALALLGDQVMAIITVTGANGINSLSNHPGYEFNVTLLTLAAVIAVFGAGRLSVDATVDHRRTRASAPLSAPRP